jgi:CHAT domain
VTGKEISHLLQGAPSSRLVILNACRSAAAPKGQGSDPLSGVAGALVRGGQSAVIGMQRTISDSAALTFSRALYESLAKGDPIEAAVSEARLAIYLASPKSTDWAAPVLFLRGADQRIEEGKVKKRQPVRDVIRHHVIFGEVDGGEIEIVGASQQDSALRRVPRRPRSVHSKAEIKKISGDKITIVGSKE